MFREAPLPDGKAGPVSWRRVASAILLVAALALFGAALFVVQHMTTAAWVVFIPGALCLLFSALMPILTTITDVQALIHAVTGKTTSEARPALAAIKPPRDDFMKPVTGPQGI